MDNKTLKNKLFKVVSVIGILLLLCSVFAMVNTAEAFGHHHSIKHSTNHMTFGEWNKLPDDEKSYRTIARWNERYHKGLTDEEIWAIVEQRKQKREQQKNKVEAVNNTTASVNNYKKIRREH